MPFRLGEDFPNRTKIQFIAPAWMPNRIYKACVATDTASNTRYVQEAVCKQLSRDLNIPLQDLLDDLPEGRGPASRRIDRGTAMVGPANTYEEVK
jgi:hypothetical protein